MALDLASLPLRFGPYVLVRPLGGGGMGNVFLGVYGAQGAEKLCVVKRLIPETLTDSSRRARFTREAEIARRLSHGAIAKTIAVDEVDGEPFIVQEYLEGRTLAQLRASALSVGQPLPLALAIHVVREVARGLAYAHRLDGRGIVHRDVAPENIMVTFSGEVRLIDFGIARASTDPSLTEPGMVVGRKSYTAPELLNGAVADNRADIYSLGVVLWELLSGRPLMIGEIGKVPPPSTMPTALDVLPELDAVVLRAVAPKLSDRFQTVEDFQRELGAFLPAGFVGEPALREFIRYCYDVETERAHVAEAVAEARPLLDVVTSASISTQPSSAGRRAAVAVAVTAIIVLAGAGAFVYRRSRSAAAEGNRLEVPTPREALAKPPAVEKPPAGRALPLRPAPVATVASPARPAAAEPSPQKRSTVRRATPAGPSAGILLDQARDAFQIGDVGSAERDARSVLQAKASAAQKARAHVILGQVALIGGHRPQAEASFASALQLDPTNEAAAAELTRLRRHGGGGDR